MLNQEDCEAYWYRRVVFCLRLGSNRSEGHGCSPVNLVADLDLSHG
jgi:hypothetical protein